MPPDTLDGWLKRLEAGASARIELGLERVAAVLERLRPGPPPWLVITVGGTNGKGSSIALLASILEAAGHAVGCYTSPHLLRYNERVRIGGREATDDALCSAFAAVEAARGEVALTYFEFGTLAALELFWREAPRVVLLEVGLGGRLDACNVLDADLALLGTIDIDHESWLGRGRDAIGREKAGILRAGRPAVCGDPEPPAGFLAEAAARGAVLHLAGRDFQFEPEGPGWRWRGGGRERRALPLPGLPGRHQVGNAAAVLMALELLGDRLPVGQGAVRRGLAEAALPGRFQHFPGEVELVLDVAHNVQAVRELVHQLGRRPCAGRSWAVASMLADKDIEGAVAAAADAFDGWFVAGLEDSRGLGGEAFAARVRAGGVEPRAVCASVEQAHAAARRASSPGDRIVAFGSFLTVARVLALHV